MLYMFLAPSPSLAGRAAAPAMTASGSRFSVLALLLALVMFGYVVRVAGLPALAEPGVTGADGWASA